MAATAYTLNRNPHSMAGIEPNHKPDILYLDDEERNLQSFQAAFRRHYTIHTAKNVQEAVEVMRNHPIAVLVSDQRMPGMAGVEFMEAIIPEFPMTTRILLTGFSDIEAIISAINEGEIFRYITKPWDENELKQSIDSGVKLFNLKQKNSSSLALLHDKSYQQERILNLFSRYVPKHVVDEALQNYKGVEGLFAGESRIVSVLFANINNIHKFYKISDPQSVYQYINVYFANIAEIIERHKGVIDKFINGSMMAIFGAPVSTVENQINSIYCALEIQEMVEKFNIDHANQIGCELEVGCGIHTGEAVVGNVGAKQFITYTAIGNTVNTAARIVELTKEHPGSIYISQDIFKLAEDFCKTKLIGETKIRGKENPLILYTVEGKKL